MNLILFCLMSLLLIACDDSEGGRSSAESYQLGMSDIQMAPTLKPNSIRIGGLHPLDGQGISVSEKTKFTWDLVEDVEFYTLVFLKKIPTWKSDNSAGFKSVQTHCVGGTSQLAGDDFYNKIFLSTKLQETEIASCDLESKNGLISATNARSNDQYVIWGDENFDGKTDLFWAILGYNKNYQLLATSSVQELILEDE